ncbi:MAG TPA: secretin N-terminal domain-containing protein [Pyrinomonadaceae bacterium]|nr:hypothetical protein [Chloracidobacterium sp.]HRJ87107.1 secretin N-terminal domain-containing protein [Pyrinomonadaceae bacterium]HRK52030.1 secretin N-terminal domain-containing protein [Pyrinomonadaceae bacterium]
MKIPTRIRFSLTLFLLAAFLSPTAVMALGDGKKYFKTGMKHEAAEEWDQAAEAFALAVNENPKNPEYRLHLRRALFNASQMYMKKGRLAADEKDYEGAYIAFRKAYAFDPVNELAKAEMARMVRLQEAKKNEENPGATSGDVKMVQTSANGAAVPDFQIPQKLEKLRDVPFPSGVNLQFIIKELAKDLDLNVLFDAESRLENRSVRIELKNVTAARALDYIFLQENLFFQRVGPRTILVANTNRRTNFQQLVLRTFYLANASPKDVKTVVQTAIPAQPGRAQTIVLEDAATNSITIRDTQENIRLIGKLIASLDKDRAEVVMDVAIYEVSKTDLLRLGNQIGNESQLTSLGGTTRGVVGLGGNDLFAQLSSVAGQALPTAFGVGIAIPAANLIAFQAKGNTKLLASTQIHAFNNEDSSARIGQRVPVRTAQFVTGSNQSSDGVVSNVINYEQVGLTLKFKPIVFPNQDVQVAMEIESKDVVAGGTDGNPIFSERSIKGTARVQNNRTLLLASVAQDVESRGRSGLPLLGLIPILGRLFSAPTRDNRQVDVVIAVTPRVIRAPAILPEDEVERPTGSVATPTSGSLEAMITQEEREEYLASVRRLPTTTAIQLPDQPSMPEYVRGGTETAAIVPKAEQGGTSNPIVETGGLTVKPIDASVRQLEIKQTSEEIKGIPPDAANESDVQTEQSANGAINNRTAKISFLAEIPDLKAGQRIKLPVLITGSDPFGSAVLGLRFDEKLMAVRSVAYGDVFGGAMSGTEIQPFLNQGGRTFVSLTASKGLRTGLSGTLAVIEFEALADGTPTVNFDKDVLNILGTDGKNFLVRF